MLVAVSKINEAIFAVLLKGVKHPVDVGTYCREVESQNQELCPQCCRMLVYPPFSEEFFEAIGVVDVIIAFKHTQREALAETPGADEEEKRSGLLYQWDKVGFIYVIIVFEGEAGVVAQTVWNFFCSHDEYCFKNRYRCKGNNFFFIMLLRCVNSPSPVFVRCYFSY